MGCKFNFMNFCRKITVEPILFIEVLAASLIGVISQNLIITKVCHAELGVNASANCDLDASQSASEKAQIKESMSQYILYNSWMKHTIPILIVLCLGVWSDRTGRRKPLMILSLIGTTLASAGLLINAHFLTWHPYLIILTVTLPGALCGDGGLMSIACMAYISDSSGSRSRTLRLGFMTAVAIIGAPIGLYVGLHIFQQTDSYMTLYGISFGLHCVSLLYMIFIIPEVTAQVTDLGSNDPEEEIDQGENGGTVAVTVTQSTKNKMADEEMGTEKIVVKNEKRSYLYMVLDYVFGSFKTILAPRSRHMRKCLVAVLAIKVLCTVTGSEGSFRYLYARIKFGWTESEFSTWTITQIICIAIGVTLMMPIMIKIFKFSDAFIGLIATFCSILSRLVWALTPQSKFLYYAAPLDIPGALEELCAYSLFSKIFSRNERGRAFAFQGFVTDLIPLMAAPLYSAVYTRTSDPGFIFYVSSLIYVVVCLLFGTLFVARRLKLVKFDDDDELVPSSKEVTDKKN